MEHTYHFNSHRFTSTTEAAASTCVDNLSHWKDAVDEIRSWPEYEPRPLRDLDGFARQMGIDKLYFKDESLRFGPDMGSFKALGAPNAVYRLLAEAVRLQTGTFPSSDELRSRKFKHVTRVVTVCVATDGNQGRGLAYGAKIFGCRCVVYIHNYVSITRAEMMKRLGAVVIRIDGEYEASVARAKEDARMNDWHFVSSTSWDDFDQILPRSVMNGYMVVVEEALNALRNDRVTHVFVCGGVGSIAAAIFLGFHKQYKMDQDLKCSAGIETPRFIVVEPSEADCLLQSAKKGEPCLSEGSLHTLMAGLACRGPSPAAMKILMWLTSDFIAVPDYVSVQGMKALASGNGSSIPVVCGESSAVAMGIMLQIKENVELRNRLGLNANSRVLLFGLEGATDPIIYEKLVGRPVESVFAAQKEFVKQNAPIKF